MSPSTRDRSLGRRSVAKLAAMLCGALVLSGCSVYDAPLPGGADTGDNPMTIKVMFRDVLDLVPQSSVRVNDVVVGKVSAVDLKGYVAEVTVQVPEDVKLPDNARAEIRQTSLLGEKFVELSEPREPGTGKLADKDVIGLDRTGRNPEVEEVLGALSLLLNGGGVGQLKTIVSELNNTFEGRESEIRSVLTQMRIFVSQLDGGKESIIAALENTNRLALQLKGQDRTIKSALDNVPDTLRSVNRQRDDLVKLLEALERLSGVGVRVIKASKESTINSLRDLAPVLNGFAKAGDDFPKAFQVFLTYPFIDEAVGRNPRVARNIHFGDYTNLSARLDLNIGQLPGVCEELEQVLNQTEAAVRQGAKDFVDAIPANPLITPEQRGDLEKAIVEDLLAKTLAAAKNQCETPDPTKLTDTISDVGTTLLDTLDILSPLQVRRLLNGQLGQLGGSITGGGGGGGVGGGGGGGGGVTLPSNPLGRAQLGSGFQTPAQPDPFGLASYGLDPGIGTMLLQGVAEVR